MKQRFELPVLVLLGLTLAACGRSLPTASNGAAPSASNRVAVGAAPTHPRARVFAAAGDINASVNAFRDALGALNANVPGSRDGGRREINWDAVPAAFTNTNDFPADFFNQPVPGRARGAVFSTRGTGLRVSDNNFTDLNRAFASEFVFFSPVRTFAAVGSNRMATTFFVPGSNVPATTTGFGVVFSDVDREGSATIRLFDAAGRSLGRYAAPTAPGGVSFVGVMFPTAIVARVEIKSGQAPVSPGATDIGNRTRGDDDADDGDRSGEAEERDRAAGRDDRDHDAGRPRDLVIMDDFIYGEPIPAPGSARVALGSSAGVAADSLRTAAVPHPGARFGEAQLASPRPIRARARAVPNLQP